MFSFRMAKEREKKNKTKVQGTLKIHFYSFWIGSSLFHSIWLMITLGQNQHEFCSIYMLQTPRAATEFVAVRYSDKNHKYKIIIHVEF